MKPIFKTVLKKITHSALGQAVIASFCWVYIKLVLMTSRVTFEGLEIAYRLREDDQPFIVCFWHCQLLLMGAAWQSKAPFYMLISDHPDGKIISKAIEFQGFQTISGSTGKRGVFALKRIINLLKGNTACAVGITPDGPRGPRMYVSDGTLFMAQKSGVPLVPLTCTLKNCWTMNTWDRFIIPKFFNRIHFKMHPPLALHGMDKEQARQQITAALNSTQVNS